MFTWHRNEFCTRIMKIKTGMKMSNPVQWPKWTHTGTTHSRPRLGASTVSSTCKQIQSHINKGEFTFHDVLCNIFKPCMYAEYRRVPKVATPITFGISRGGATFGWPLLLGSRYFRVAKIRQYLKKKGEHNRATSIMTLKVLSSPMILRHSCSVNH